MIQRNVTKLQWKLLLAHTEYYSVAKPWVLYTQVNFQASPSPWNTPELLSVHHAANFIHFSQSSGSHSACRHFLRLTIWSKLYTLLSFVVTRRVANCNSTVLKPISLNQNKLVHKQGSQRLTHWLKYWRSCQDSPDFCRHFGPLQNKDAHSTAPFPLSSNRRQLPGSVRR